MDKQIIKLGCQQALAAAQAALEATGRLYSQGVGGLDTRDLYYELEESVKHLTKALVGLSTIRR